MAFEKKIIVAKDMMQSFSSPFYSDFVREYIKENQLTSLDKVCFIHLQYHGQHPKCQTV